MKDENKTTKLKVKIEKPGNYGLGYINGDISEDKPTIIDWGNGMSTKLTTPITSYMKAKNSTDFYITYSEPGEYEISIDGWYNHFACYDFETWKSGVTQIYEVLIEVVQVSSLITSFFYTFSACSSLTSIPSGLFENNTNVTDFFSAFYGCSSLTNIPSGLFNKNAKVTDFSLAFIGCSNLTGETPYTLSSDGVTKIKLWDSDETNGFTNPIKTGRTFYGCTKLSDYEDIPIGWK